MSAPPADASTLETAVGLARAAGDITLRWFRSADLEVERKADGSPVTEADRSAERYLREQITEQFPGDGILGEEEVPLPSTTGRRWILDPIDGTKAFTCGVPLYTNLLALEDEHGIAVGVINVPALGETVWAGRGLGAHSERGPARVSGVTDLAGAFVMTSGVDGWEPDRLAALDAAGVHLRTWGDGYGYALVATGRAEAMIDPSISLWDVAPMPVILAEAGGRFTSTNGEATPSAGSGLATNGRVHDEILGLLS
jgi:histidinol-phosphatase